MQILFLNEWLKGLYITELIEKAFCCKTESLVSEQISLEVNSASINVSGASCCITFHKCREINLYCSIFQTNEYLWITYLNLCRHHVTQILEIPEIKFKNVRVSSLNCELCIRIYRNVIERIVWLWFDKYISVGIASLLCIHISKSLFVDNLALKIKYYFVRTTEVKEKARIIAWQRVKIIWSISAFTAFVESRVSNIDKTFGVECS